MHPNEIADLLSGDALVDKRWPPEAVAEHWRRVADHRRRYTNDAADLFRYRTDLHIREDAQATADKAATFTPVGLARDLCRFSAQLLFSDPPKVTVEGDEDAAQQALDLLADENDLPAFLHDAADNIAAEGSGAIRIVIDDDVNDGRPLLCFEPADTVLWSVRYGRFVEGGVLVVARERDGVHWRLLEEHGVAGGSGYVRRRLYKGSASRLGQSVGLSAGGAPPEFRGLRDEFRTGIDRPTLIRWQNVPGGHSDLAGIEALLDELDEGESIGREKLEASKALKFVNRRLADDAGNVDLSGVIFLDSASGPTNPVEQPSNLAEIVQPSLQAQDHVIYLNHVRELAVTMAGYSLASWGLDQSGGTTDSGRALKLRQSRTLLTRAGKERMAVGAISEALSVALQMLTGGPPAAVDVELGDGMPVDPVARVQELQSLRAMSLLTNEAALRTLHPEWTEEQIDAEAENIRVFNQSADDREFLSGVSRVRDIIERNEN